MNRHSKIRRFIQVITITSVVVFGYTFSKATVTYTNDSVDSTVGIFSSAEASLVHIPTVKDGYPSRFKMPSLGIDAAVQHVSITTKNTIGVPNNFKDVGWYVNSPAPGQPGSAIIDGHVDNGLGLAGVFKNLSKSNIGDDVEVVNVSGKKNFFKIIKIENYPFESTSTSAFAYPVDGSYLMLITCSGKWIPARKTYDTRTIVIAKLVDQI
jgi:sortase (surface protein transpeptidase)